jgi:hypothetical protein
MKQYKVRPGIVKTEICGVRLLVPTRQASEACPGVLRLSMMTDFAWTLLCNTEDPGEAVEKIRKVVALLSKAPDDVVIERVDRLLSGLCEKGFLIETEGPHDD